jgi:hypothetical protein
VARREDGGWVSGKAAQFGFKNGQALRQADPTATAACRMRPCASRSTTAAAIRMEITR